MLKRISYEIRQQLVQTLLIPRSIYVAGSLHDYSPLRAQDDEWANGFFTELSDVDVRRIKWQVAPQVCARHVQEIHNHMVDLVRTVFDVRSIAMNVLD